MVGKTSLIVLIAVVAAGLALFGKNFAVFAGLSFSFIAMILVLLDMAKILQKIPVLNMLSGKASPQTLGILFVVLLLINIGAVGAIFSGITGPSVIPMGSVTTQNSAPIAAGTGNSYQGKLVISPQAATGGTYTGSGTLILFNALSGVKGVNFGRYDVMKNIADNGLGTAMVQFGTDTAQTATVSSGDFTFKSVSAKVGDQFEVFGYQDVTPAQGEGRSWAKTLQITGYSDNNQQLQWAFTDGSSSTPKWTNYGTLVFTDNTGATKTSYLDNETSAVTAQPYDIYMVASNNGDEVIDASLYTEAASSVAGNMKQAKVCYVPQFGDSKCVTYTVPQNADILASSDPIFLNAPSKTTSTDTMYFWGKFPIDAIRSSATDKAKYQITLSVDHPGNAGPSLYYPKVIMNSGAKANSNGKIAGPTFTLNQTNTSTTGYS